MIATELPDMRVETGAALDTAVSGQTSALELSGRLSPGDFKGGLSYHPTMQSVRLAWYCARTKPKHEHIAAGNIRKNLGLEVFHPRLRMERATRRGVVRTIEPLFPCYIFVRCVIQDSLNDIKYTGGVNSFVHFGNRIPTIPNPVIEELQECFEAEEPMMVNDHLSPGDEVVIGDGAFAGMKALVLRVLSARQRVQVLLDILGRHTLVEVDRKSVALEESTVADMAPLLAVSCRKMSQV